MNSDEAIEVETHPGHLKFPDWCAKPDCTAPIINGVPLCHHSQNTAWDREETEPCERGTVGCSVLHGSNDSECETW